MRHKKTPHPICYNRVDKKPLTIAQEKSYSDTYDTKYTSFFGRYFFRLPGKFENDKPAFLSLPETHIDIDEFVPISCRNHFYVSSGRTHKYPLQVFLWDFTIVLDVSKISHFKQDFLDELQLVLDNLVDVTEPICQELDSAKANMTIFGSCKAAYGSMPAHASANPEINKLYIYGHFCYVFKFAIVTNGLRIIRHISFYNKDFMASHPDIIVEKKSDSPDQKNVFIIQSL